jgi:anthranilate synthase/aminodeoxychorismate synthase-like glutamine amidotransferase
MILLIDNYDSFTYNLYQAIGELNPNIVVFRNDERTLEEFLEMDIKALVISPGPGYPKDAGVTIPLIKALAPKIPILGVCLGHQAIIEAFGGRIVNAQEIVHGKSSLIYHHNSRILRNLPQPFEAGRYHSLMGEKETFPSQLIIEAESSDGKIMAIRHKEFPCYGVQFHPESILTPQGNIIIRNFLELAELV